MDLTLLKDLPLFQVTGDFIAQIAHSNALVVAAFFFLFVILAYKAVQMLMKAFVIGLISASFPVVAFFLGLDVPLSIGSVLTFGIFGASAYILYSMITGSVKLMKLITSPFRRFFREKPKEYHHHVRTVVIEKNDKKKR